MERKIKKIAIRELIEYTLRSGNITSVSLSSARAVDGIRAHQKFQREAGDGYQQEIPVSISVPCDEFDLILQGRIDGVIVEDDGVIIDEIKSTGGSIEEVSGENLLHWAQVKMYAYIYGKQEDLSELTIRLTYIELEDFRVKHFTKKISVEKLKEYFYEVIKSYLVWAKKQEDWHRIKNRSIEQLAFPFDGYREGQRQLMAGVYRTIEEGQRLFSRAPTGIGKTIATLFPAIKALGKEKSEKLFYLTAKTIGKEVASKTLNILEENGLEVKRVIITAKDKICLNDVTSCNEQDCPYAKGHYDRVNFVLEEMFEKHDCFNRELIEQYSEKYKVCPYEVSLDLATFSDIIICDYNYAFDPVSLLKRFFVEGAGKYTLLVDEAHNLVDRAREMYSASIDKDQVLDLKKKVKDLDRRLYRYFNQLNKILIEERKKCTAEAKGFYIEKEAPYEIEDALRGVIYRTEKIFKIYKDWQYMDDLLDFFFAAFDFVKKFEIYDENYITYYNREGHNLIVKLFCINPSDNLKAATEKMQGVVFFSATLLPLDYYVKILGGDTSSYGLNLSSPFDRNNLCLLVENNISTKYVDRETSIEPIIQLINKVVGSKKGNYIIFFPSYLYMEKVYDQFLSLYDNENIELAIQYRGLNEKEKEAFIGRFSEERKHSFLVFAVLGGMFSEGIDLTGEQLSCSMIVGVGLPQICTERNIIKNFFIDHGSNGFDYAYVFPGMNKVLQGAGRVIRTVTDRGVVVLIDSRFPTRHYQRLFPDEWDHYKIIRKDKDIRQYLEEFW